MTPVADGVVARQDPAEHEAARRLLADLPPSPAVWCTGLHKRYGRQKAVDGVMGKDEVKVALASVIVFKDER